MPDPQKPGPSIQGAPDAESLMDQLKHIFLGVDDPNVLMGVSAFGPDKVARMAATEAAKGSLLRTTAGMGHAPEAIDAAMAILDKFPRVAAHVAQFRDMPIGAKAAGASGLNLPASRTGNPKMSQIGLLDQRGYENKGMVDQMYNVNPLSAERSSFLDMPTNVAHELTHAAQRINKGAALEPDYYAKNAERGYWDNPYEIGAREAAAKKVPPTDAIARVARLLGLTPPAK